MYCYHRYHYYPQSHYRLEVLREVRIKLDHISLGFETRSDGSVYLHQSLQLSRYKQLDWGDSICNDHRNYLGKQLLRYCLE